MDEISSSIHKVQKPLFQRSETLQTSQEEVEQLRVNQKVEALHLNRKYLDAKYASKCAPEGSEGEEVEPPKNPFEAMTISSMMTASSLGIFEVRFFL